MIQRTAADVVRRMAAQFPVVAITGPRQSGKTTLAQMVFPDKRYVSFDDINLRRLANEDPVEFLLSFPDGAVIDEAQKVPDIFDAIKLAADRDYVPGKFVITGSSQLSLRKNMSDSLAGRIGAVQLLPLSVEELLKSGKADNPYDLMLKGQYAPLYDDTKKFIENDWFENYIDFYIDRDVREQINPSNLSVFKKFIQICALHSGQLLSMESISRDTGVSAVTVKSWLSILETSYIIHFMEPDTDNLGRNLVKTPKLYFTDTGLLCHLLRINSKEELLLHKSKGAVVETFAVSEILKSRINRGRKPYLTFFRDVNGFEVDVVADWGHRFAIEVKSAGQTAQKLAASLKKYISLKNSAVNGAVFYLGDETLSVNGISYVGWKDWDRYCGEQG